MTRSDNLRARQIYPQVHILKPTLHVVIVVVILSAGLMRFDQVRSVGPSMLASSGVLGIILGFAAHRTIPNLFAGCQTALTQPFGSTTWWSSRTSVGRIEEIRLTYVVLCI